MSLARGASASGRLVRIGSRGRRSRSRGLDETQLWFASGLFRGSHAFEGRPWFVLERALHLVHDPCRGLGLGEEAWGSGFADGLASAAVLLAEDDRLDGVAVHGFEGVGDDHVDLLAVEFGVGGGEEFIAGFQGESHHELVGAAALGDFGEEVGRRFEFEGEVFVFAAKLAAEELGVDLGAIVGDGGGHDEDVGVGNFFPQKCAEVLAGTESAEADAGIGGHRGDGAQEERDLHAAASGLVGEGEAHLAGGAVADEPDGVDGLVGGAGGDEESGGHAGGVGMGCRMVESGDGAGMRRTDVHRPGG